MSPLRLTFLGPPGAGKGTQAQQLAHQYELLYLSTGDMLREAAEADNQEGATVREYAYGGGYAPDEFISAMVRGRLQGVDGYILDGYPRTVPQAETLLASASGQLTAAVLINMPDSALERRLTGRLLCPQCQRNYHPHMRPPRQQGICDDDSAVLERREDDAPKLLTTRLTAYHKLTEPLISFYRQIGLLRSVDGNQSVEAVYADILQALKI